MSYRLKPMPPAYPPLWGETSPCLRIAKHYGADWGMVLGIMDWVLHRRSGGVAAWTREINSMDYDRYRLMCEDIREEAWRIKRLWERAEVARHNIANGMPESEVWR